MKSREINALIKLARERGGTVQKRKRFVVRKRKIRLPKAPACGGLKTGRTAIIRGKTDTG